uniref:Selenoprotein F n=2 Tax=Cacopsylla melanoneura TaxID=428564 RepID=A0A8D8QYT5_9HEMI
MNSSKLLPFVAVLTALINAVLSEFTSDDCASLGLNKANLLCSSCDQLSSFDLNILKDHCLQCCHPGETTTKVQRYAKARLEVCTCKFGAYPQIQAFCKSDRPAKFKNLQIRYVRGLDPIIKLLDKDDNVQEVLAIEKWNTDSVEEFLKTHLENDEVVIAADKEEPNRDYLETNMV